jgi:formate dehydrogenase subunit delta
VDINKLVYMANQIGKAFNHESEQAAIDSIAGHIRSFWDPRMKKAIVAHVHGDGGGLDPRVLAAVRSLQGA